MADVEYVPLDLVGYHEPDSSLEVGPDGNKVSVPLPGTYHVGVLVGGRFLELRSAKAGNLVDDNNEVAANQGPQDSSQG